MFVLEVNSGHVYIVSVLYKGVYFIRGSRYVGLVRPQKPDVSLACQVCYSGTLWGKGHNNKVREFACGMGD